MNSSLLSQSSNESLDEQSQSLLPQQDLLMIVDDSLFNIFALTKMLACAGIEEHRILKASNGLEAIEVFLENKSRVKTIFMDIDMPVLNGLQATRYIKDSTEDDYPNIIAYSSHSDPDTLIECKISGMDHFLQKPCTQR